MAVLITVGRYRAWISSPRTLQDLLPFFKAALEHALNTSGRDLTIIAYLDEYTTGNPLANDTRRKAWGAMWGILECGPEYLCHEAA